MECWHFVKGDCVANIVKVQGVFIFIVEVCTVTMWADKDSDPWEGELGPGVSH